MASFLTLGDTGDGELSYFRQLLEVAQTKADNVGYAERRAQEMANSANDDSNYDEYSLEEEIQLAMEEILEKEKDMKQLVQTAQFLFERSQEMGAKCEEQASQIAMLMNEQARMVDSVTHNENRVQEQKERIMQLERMEIDLER